MRELKFRTYDFVMQRYDDAPEMYATTDGHLEPSGNKIIEQYTNLKDKNGKEIYEGDIVRYVSEGESICLAVVKRKDEDKEQSYWLTGFVYEPFAIVDEEELTEEEYESLGGMEVIGNIHENKELLGGK